MRVGVSYVSTTSYGGYENESHKICLIRTYGNHHTAPPGIPTKVVFSEVDDAQYVLETTATPCRISGVFEAMRKLLSNFKLSV